MTTETPRATVTMAPLLVSVPDAAKLLGLSRSAVYELVKKGELPAMHYGQRVLVSVAGLRSWAEQGLEAVAQEQAKERLMVAIWEPQRTPKRNEKHVIVGEES